MPESNNKTFETPVPAFAIASAEAMPLQFEQVVSDAPDGMKVTTQPPAIKLTRKSVRKSIKRNAVIASHWLNLPLVDGLISVSRTYKVIEKMAFNYQREHQDAFFEAYPDMLILSDTERSLRDQLTTSVLRRDYRKYAKRVAHYYYQYCEAKKMQTGALANLLLLTRFNGNEMWKKIASDVKWSKINGHCNLYERFPSPVGLEAYITQYSRYAAGKTTYGADIISFPLWITDIWGNRMNHSIPVDSLTVLANKDLTYGTGPLQAELHKGAPATVIDPNMQGYQGLNPLFTNMKTVAERYGYSIATNGTNNETPFGVVPPSMPKIENGSTLSALSKDGTQEASCKLNLDGTAGAFTGNGVTDNLTGRLWRNYDFWTAYMVKAFPEMMDPNSDLYSFASEQLKTIQPSSKLEDMLNAIRANKQFDITSLAEKMVYKGGGAATTANIIKFAPLIFANDADVDDIFKDDSVFAGNYERYSVDDTNTVAMISDSKKWPGLAPTIFFGNGNFTPVVMNATSMAGYDFDGMPTDDDKWDASKRSYSITGKVASYADFVRASSYDPENSRVEAVGVTDEYLKEFMLGIHDAVVYEEYPDFLSVLQQPLIDNSDLSQCGFNVVISAEDPNANDWALWFMNYANYADETGTSKQVPGGHITIDGKSVPTPYSTVYGGDHTGSGDNTVYTKAAHVANQEYLEYLGHAFVFVGGSIFQHPIQALGNRDCGFFVNRINASNGLEDMENYVGELNNIFSISPRDRPADAAFSAMLAGATNWIALKGEQTLADTFDCYYAVINLIHKSTALIASDVYQIATWMFDPAYGPIFPIMAQQPFGNLADHTPQPGVTGVYEPSIAAIAPKVTFAKVCMMPGNSNLPVNNPTDKVISRPETYAIDKTPAEDLLFFISLIQFSQVKVDPLSGEISVDLDTVYQFDLQTQGKWIYSMAAVQVAQFAGLRDTKPFWKAVLDKFKSIVINETGLMPENNILAEPRLPRAVKKPTSSYGSMHNGEKFSPKSESQLATEAYGGGKGSGKSYDDSERSHQNRRPRRRSHKRYEKKDSQDSMLMNPDGTADNAKDFKPDNSSIDISTSSQDKDLLKKKGLKADATAIQ